MAYGIFSEIPLIEADKYSSFGDKFDSEKVKLFGAHLDR